MRLLACFAKKPLILDPPPPGTEHPAADAPPHPPPTGPRGFTPTSIPELHPEYAHAEPYCFAARTDSARVLVDKLRGARGQPPLDPLQTFKDSGLVVVRGPSHNAPGNVKNDEGEQDQSSTSNNTNDNDGSRETPVPVPPPRPAHDVVYPSFTSRPRSDGHAAKLLQGEGLPSRPPLAEKNLSSTPASQNVEDPLNEVVEARSSTTKPPTTKIPARGSVPLTVEVPATANTSFVESDDSLPLTDENIASVANRSKTAKSTASRSGNASGIGRRKATRRALGPSTPLEVSANPGPAQQSKTEEEVGSPRRKSGLRVRKNSKLLGSKQISNGAGSSTSGNQSTKHPRHRKQSSSNPGLSSSSLPRALSPTPPLKAPIVTPFPDPDIDADDDLDSSSKIHSPVQRPRSNETVGSAPYAASSDGEVDELIEKHMDNTPKELLAHIPVPRTSIVFGGTPITPHLAKPTAVTAAAPLPMPNRSSQTFSPTSFEASDRSDPARYADVDGDFSSGLLALSVEPLARNLTGHGIGHHGSNVMRVPSLTERPDLASGTSPHNYLGTQSGSPSSSSLKAKRKSKPFLPPVANSIGSSTPAYSTDDSMALPPAPPATPASPRTPAYSPKRPNEAPVPTPEINSNIVPIPLTPIKQTAARQRLGHEADCLSAVPPRGSAHVPTSIMRRQSSNRRKTVNFSEAAPVIIEPNLRAPSQSLPRSAMLSGRDRVDETHEPRTTRVATPTRESTDTFDFRQEIQPEVPHELVSTLTLTRDSFAIGGTDRPVAVGRSSDSTQVFPGANVETVKAPPPVTRTGSYDPADEISEPSSSGSTDPSGTTETRARTDESISASVQEKMSRRTSRRVSAHDKVAIKAAKNRQSQAVASAMLDQIRGVPRSAMLAYSKNEIVIEHNMEPGKKIISTPQGNTSHPKRAGQSVQNSDAASESTSASGSMPSAVRTGRAGPEDMAPGAPDISHSTPIADDASRRSSKRVSMHDKAAIKAAKNRQSQAVAAAMLDQIRGVPRSAMLAYSANEVVIEDAEGIGNDDAKVLIDEELEEGSGVFGPLSRGGPSSEDADSEYSSVRSHNSLSRRASRKTIRVPKVVPGVVPAPPPPPPFIPSPVRVRSVRSPPPPPPPPPGASN